MSGHRLTTTGKGITLESVDQQEDAKTGWRTTYTYSGNGDELRSLRNLERARGAKMLQMRSRGDGNWELNVTYPWDAENGTGDGEIPTDTHELETSIAQQDVFLNPKLIAATTSLQRQILQNLVQRYKRGELGTASEAISKVNLETGSDATSLAYFKLIAFDQVDHWMFYRSVYQRTISLATPRQVQASFEGTQKLWTTAQVLAWESLPNDWWFTLPPTYKWHKSEPQVTTNIGKGSKTQIMYRYIASADASTLLYDAY